MSTNDDDEMIEYTPGALLTLAAKINTLRMSMICNVADAGSDPESEQYFLLALAALDSAHRFMTLASFKQSQGLAR